MRLNCLFHLLSSELTYPTLGNRKIMFNTTFGRGYVRFQVFAFASKNRGYLYHQFKRWHHRHAPCTRPCLKGLCISVSFVMHQEGVDKVWLHNIMRIIIIENKIVIVLDYTSKSNLNHQYIPVLVLLHAGVKSHYISQTVLLFLNEAAN